MNRPAVADPYRPGAIVLFRHPWTDDAPQRATIERLLTVTTVALVTDDAKHIVPTSAIVAIERGGDWFTHD